jgi:RNA polymerase sigma-70 factor (ECF subfamily)
MTSVALDNSLLYDVFTVNMRAQDKTSPNTNVDAALVAQASGGDMAAFETLVQRYRNEVFALSYHFVHEREQAWDISQEVFIKAFRHLNGFRGEAGFKTWLLRITANQCKDYLKKRKLDTVPLEGLSGARSQSATPTPRDQIERDELGKAIATAVDALPMKHRTAFVLREYEGLSYEEMAQVMNCSQGTVMSRLHHARKKLQISLQRMGVHGGQVK